MSVVLLILKIIGITLLVILGILLAVLLLVLLWPVTYRAEAGFEKPDIEARAKVRWFIVSVPVSFIDKKLDFSARVLGIKVFPFKEKKPKEKKSKKNDSEVLESAENLESLETSELPETKIDAAKTETTTVYKPEQFNVVEDNPIDLTDELKEIEKEAKIEAKPLSNISSADTANIASEESSEKDSEPKKKLTEKISDLIDKVTEKAEFVLSQKDEEEKDISTFFKRKTTKSSLELIKNTVIKLLLHIRPRKLTGDLELGLADPATTGYITAVMSVLYTFTEDNFEFTPVFDEEKINGHVKLKGHILLGYVVFLGLNAYLRKSFRRFIKNSMALKDSALERVDNVKENVLGGL